MRLLWIFIKMLLWFLIAIALIGGIFLVCVYEILTQDPRYYIVAVLLGLLALKCIWNMLRVN